MFIWCVGLLFIKGLFCLKITTSPEINATLESNSSISLNCKYETETNEKILNIQWKKKTSDGNYKDLVYAVKDGAYYDAPGSYLKNRSELHGFGNGSTSVILIIKHLRCIDNGQYQCSVDYSDGSGLRITQTNNTVVYIQADAKKPTDFSVTRNGSIEEHGMVKLSCVGNVGNPPGYLAIWRVINNSNTGQLLENTSVVNSDAENCTHIVNHTTYNLTRDDNGAKFRCSSQNQYTEDPGPAIDIGPIQVLYGPSSTMIECRFSNSQASIGNHVTMDCISDGNPSPNFTWKFNLTDFVNDGKYSFSVNKSRLSFTITDITYSGYYQCVASNIINGKSFNSSSNFTLRVQEKNNEGYPSNIKQTCSENPCFIFENCVLTNGTENCVVNIWTVIAFPFIALTLILCTATISLAISRIKQQKKDNIKKGFHIDDVQVSYTRETFEDFGGYADPKDVKRPENGKIKSDREGRDNPYADPVDFQTKYAVVQKNWETPANSTNDNNSSNPPHLLNNTDTSNTGNPSSPPETINPSNEKTPDSTESSETIPKPPNVSESSTNYINLLLE